MPRPRIHASATDRVEAARKRLASAGGARRTFALSARALASLALIREHAGLASDTAAVERAIEAERQRVEAR